MKIALGQLDMIWEDKNKSFEKVSKMVAQAVRDKAELIVFPEMTLTGFSMNLDVIGESAKDSETIAMMQTLAKQQGIAIGFGWSALPENDNEKGTNRFTVVDENGNVLGEYSKIHPFSYSGEDLVYQGGNHLCSFEFHNRRIALFICYDLRFGDIFQIASKDSDILLVIANWPQSRREQWVSLLQARAIENQSYIVGVNCVGNRDGIEYSGDSAAFDSLGNPLGKIADREGVLVCEIDDRAWSLREKFPARQDRRQDLYQQLSKSMED